MNDIQNQKQFSVDILDAEINGLAGFEQRRAEAYQLEDECPPPNILNTLC